MVKSATVRKAKNNGIPRWAVVVAVVAVLAVMSTVALGAIVLTRQTASPQMAAPAVQAASVTYTGKPISAKQISYINGLGTDTQRDITSFVETMFKGLTLEQLTTVQAGSVIDALNAIKYSTVTPTP